MIAGSALSSRISRLPLPSCHPHHWLQSRSYLLEVDAADGLGHHVRFTEVAGVRRQPPRSAADHLLHGLHHWHQMACICGLRATATKLPHSICSAPWASS